MQFLRELPSELPSCEVTDPGHLVLQLPGLLVIKPVLLLQLLQVGGRGLCRSLLGGRLLLDPVLVPDVLPDLRDTYDEVFTAPGLDLTKSQLPSPL